jgi:type I restriction enzyme, S subunit
MRSVALGEIVEIKGGGTPDKSNEAYWGGSIPWASVKDFKSAEIADTQDRITEQGVQNSATNVIQAGSIIVPTRMAVGKAAINLVDMAINQDLKALTPKANIDTRYLLHALLALAPQLERQATGATVKGITLEVLRSLAIPLHPLKEQKRIAAILDQADELRRKRQRAIDRLNQLGQAIFYEMFGDPKTNPLAFPTIPLGELIKVSSGSGLIASDQKGGDYPVYGGNGVNGWHDEFTVPAGTIVIGRVGVYCGAVHVTDRSAWVTDNALVVSLKRHVNPTYLATALKVANLNQYAGRSAQPLVSGSRIYPIEILNPPIEKQGLYEAKIRELEAITPRHRDALAGTEKLFSALQHRAFQGEL